MNRKRKPATAEKPTSSKARSAKAASPEAGTGSSLWRSLWSLLQLGAGVLIVLGASGAVVWGARRYALTTPRFAVKEVVIEGKRRLSQHQVLDLAGIEVGQNILALDIQKAEERLSSNSWVRDARVSRELPNALHIEISEYQASALAAMGNSLYLVTRTGEPFKTLEEGDPYDLPVITGITAESVKRDRKQAVKRLGIALQVLRHYERLSLSRIHPPQEIHLRRGGEAVLTVGKRGIALHLGEGPWRRKLLMAERVMNKLQAKGQLPGIVFVDNRAHPERVVVRMR